MIVGFSRHGTGRGAGPVDYMIDPKREGRERHPPQVVRGSPENTKHLIDSLEFKHKYTSGVLSFAPNEKITPKQENAIIERFEQMAFAGLDADQYNILWVRHIHAGHHELHFVTPRVELSTGNSLNIKPPGERTQQHFDDFRSEINARYGLADPDDPNRMRNVAIPDHELKITSESLRRSLSVSDNPRIAIDAILTQRATEGAIRSRDDLIEQINELELTVTRTGKDYITVCDPQINQRWRLKGALYGERFEPSTAIESPARQGKRDYSKPDPAAAQRFEARVERHISARTEYHQKRYPQATQRPLMAITQEQGTLAFPDRTEPLSGALVRQLGNDALLDRRDHDPTEEHSSARAIGRQNQPSELWQEQSQVCTNRSESRSLRGKQRLPSDKGVLNDRTGNPFVERIKAFGERVQQTTERFRAITASITANVRTYLGAKQPAQLASEMLERSNQQINQLVHLVHRKQTEIKFNNEPERGHGLSR